MLRRARTPINGAQRKKPVHNYNSWPSNTAKKTTLSDTTPSAPTAPYPATPISRRTPHERTVSPKSRKLQVPCDSFQVALIYPTHYPSGPITNGCVLCRNTRTSGTTADQPSTICIGAPAETVRIPADGHASHPRPHTGATVTH